MLRKFTNSIGNASKRIPIIGEKTKSFGAAAAVASKPANFYNPAPHMEDDRSIVPKFWTGVSAVEPEKFILDCSKFDMKKIVVPKTSNDHVSHTSVNEVEIDYNNPETNILIDEMTALFKEVGVVNCVNTGLTTLEEMEKLSKTVSGKGMWYEGGANLRGYLERNVYDTGAPRQANIHYHSEMAYVKESTKWIAFLCEHAAKDPMRGSTFLSCKVKATDEIMSTAFGHKLKEKGVCYVRKLPDLKYFKDNNLDSSIVYNYWQTSMGTDDMDEAVEVANRKGLEVEWEDSPVFGRYMVTKFYISGFEYCPYTDRNLLYSSLADDYMWFDTWPGVKALPHWERPLKLNFGDDEVMTREEKQTFIDVYDNAGIPIYWRPGDFAIICNYRYAHGRPQYGLEPDEKRELGVVLGEAYMRQEEKPGKW